MRKTQLSNSRQINLQRNLRSPSINWLEFEADKALIIFSAIIYALTLIGIVFVGLPLVFACTLLIVLPFMAFIHCRLAISLILLSSPISLGSIFFPVDTYGGFTPGMHESILTIGYIDLNFNAISLGAILITSIIIILITGKLRGLQTIGLPFLLFLVIVWVVWALRFPTIQGLRTGVLFITPVIFAIAVFSVIENYKDIESLQMAILIAVPTAVAITLVLSVAGLRPAFAQPDVWNLSGVSRFMGASIPPQAAWSCIPPLALLLGKIKVNKKSAWKGILFYLMVIAATVSRSSTAVAFVLIFFTVLFIKGGKIKGVIAISILFALLVGTMGHAYMARSFAKETDDIINTSSRTIIWAHYIGLIKGKPLLGHGLGSDSFREDKGITIPHNDYMRLWFSLGIIGLMAYLFAMIVLCRHVIVKAKTQLSQETQWAALMLFGALALQALTDNQIFSFHFMVPVLTIVAMSIRSHELDDALLQ